MSIISRLAAFGAAALLLCCPPARAQQAVSPRDSVDIDLPAALEIALSESPGVRIAGKEIARKEYALKGTRAGLLPNLALGASYNRTLQKQKMSIGEQQIEVGTDNQWGAGLSLSLPLVAPALWKTLQLSETDVLLAAEQARSSRIALIGSVKNAYYSLLNAQDAYEVLKVSYANAELSASIATDKYEQGLVSEYDKLRADVQLRNQKPQLIAAGNAVRLANMQLKVLMGVGIDEPMRFTGTLSDFEPEMMQDMDILAADTSLAANTELKQIDIQAEQLDLALRITRSQYLPTLSLSGNYQWSSLNNDFRIGHYQWFPYATVGVTLSIPIYEGSFKRHRLAQDKIGIDQLELQRQDLVRQLELSVQNSLNSIEKSIEEVGSNRESVREAERAYSISQKRYEVGSGNLLELNDSEVALTRARLAYNQSIYNYLSARADLEATLGKAVEENAYPALRNGK